MPYIESGDTISGSTTLQAVWQDPPAPDPTPYVVDDVSLTATADAIRTKGGTSALIEWKASKGFADAIDAIALGYTGDDLAGGLNGEDIVISSATEIAANAFYVSKLKSVSAPNVTTIKQSAFQNSTVQSVSFPTFVGNSATVLGNNVFSGCQSLTSISMPLFECYGGVSAMFQTCVNLETVSFPEMLKAGSQTFYNCTKLKNVSIPKVNDVQGSAFQGCTALTSITLPSLNGRLMSSAFYGCTSLVTVDISNSSAVQSTLSQIQASVFANCSALTTLIIRAPFVYTLANTSAFTGCTNFAHIYVPSDLVDSYKAATNWATYSSLISAIPS